MFKSYNSPISNVLIVTFISVIYCIAAYRYLPLYSSWNVFLFVVLLYTVSSVYLKGRFLLESSGSIVFFLLGCSFLRWVGCSFAQAAAWSPKKKLLHLSWIYPRNILRSALCRVFYCPLPFSRKELFENICLSFC